MQGIHLRKYGVETIINFELYEVDGVDLRVDAADAGSDCNIRKDQGADATCENDFVDEGMGYSLTLTATEMEAKCVTLHIIDSATKVWLDKTIEIETYGNASAQHAFDLTSATVTLADGGITAAKLGADAITNAKIADNAIAVENIKDAAITAAKLAGDCITNAKIADNAFAVEQFKDACLTAAKLAGDCITEAKIADDAIAAEHIADAAIDNATFAADVGSTAHGDNIIALAVRKILEELNLDHLMKVVVSNRDTIPEVVDDTVLANLMTKTDGDTSDFDHATDSLEAIRDAGGGDATEAKQDTIITSIGTIPALDGGAQTIGAAIAKLADDNDGADYDAGDDSLNKIRDRGDASWAGAPESVSGTVVVDTADTIFDLTATGGTLSGEDDTYNDMIICILDNSGSIYETAKIEDYDGGNTRITIDHELTFPVDDGVDTFVIYRNAYAPTGSASVSDANMNTIVDKMCDEDVLAAHQTPGTVGSFIRRSGSRY